MKKLIIWGAATVAIIGGCAVVWLQAAAPAIDSVAANPAYIVINIPTPVVFTAKITDPTVQPAVNLLKVDAAGKTLSTVGTMKDDGLNGDAAVGDKTFTLRVTISQPTVGQIYYRVSAPFKGVLQRVLSPVMAVTTDPVALPPHPGEPGKQTLAGIDSDADGIRDDVQRHIALTISAEPLRLSAKQLTSINQRFLLASEATAAEVAAIAQERHSALACLIHVTGSPEDALVVQQELRAILLNTKARSAAYIAADAMLSGRYFPQIEPAQFSQHCRF